MYPPSLYDYKRMWKRGVCFLYRVAVHTTLTNLRGNVYAIHGSVVPSLVCSYGTL